MVMLPSATLTSAQTEWLTQVGNELPVYLESLAVPGRPGRFLPCRKGATELGRQAALGFSCFALKTYYTWGLWQHLNSTEQASWIAFLKSFQVNENPIDDPIGCHAFIDPPVTRNALAQISWWQRLRSRFFFSNDVTRLHRVIVAETKQAVATLAQVGESPQYPYRHFPSTPEAIENYLAYLDWSKKPWGAGGQTAALVVLCKTQAPLFLGQAQTDELIALFVKLFDQLADAATGAYFKGTSLKYAQLINGAMKVLTALDWLNVPVHYPERLIDTCLAQLPSSRGCHLVDAVYVLHRCRQQTDYRKADIQRYCADLLDMVRSHYNADGGFSFHVGRSQTIYYRVPIAHGLAESDIQGTCLLSWAVAMILELLESNHLNLRVIKP